MSDSVFIFIVSFVIENSQGDIDDREHKKTVIKVEDFLEVEPGLSSFFD